jgi:hypothetical protein
MVAVVHLINALMQSLMVVKVMGKCVVVLLQSNALGVLPVLIIQMMIAILLLVELIVLEFANAMSVVL